jgi:hypothetical protein
MQIGTDLRLALPVRWASIPDDSPLPEGVEPPTEPRTKLVATLWAYHTPLSRDLFEANYRIIAAANDQLTATDGLPNRSGPAVATFALRDAAKRDAAQWGSLDEQDPGGFNALMAAIRNATNVLVPAESKWQYMPVPTAIDRKVIDQDEWTEAESAISFFTCVWPMMPRRARQSPRMLSYLALVLGASTTSLTLTDFAASLPISTPSVTSGAAAVSSVPS